MEDSKGMKEKSGAYFSAKSMFRRESNTFYRGYFHGLKFNQESHLIIAEYFAVDDILNNCHISM